MLLKCIFFCMAIVHKKPAEKGKKDPEKLLKRGLLPFFFVHFDGYFAQIVWRNFLGVIIQLTA